MTDILNGSKAFLMIPASIAHNKLLLKQPKAILLLGEIISMLNVTGVFYINNNTLSKRLDCTKRSIINYLDLLEECDLIKRKFSRNSDGKVVKREIIAGDGLTRAFTVDWTTHDEIEFTPGETAFTTPSEAEFTTPVKQISTKESINKENNNNRNIYSSAKAEPAIYKEVIDYLNEKAGTKYKSSSAVNRRLIDARIKDGYSLDDFKVVIQNKCATWFHDSKMSKYLRPQTLFGTKFESYLNEKVTGSKPHVEIAQEAFATGGIEGVNEEDLPF